MQHPSALMYKPQIRSKMLDKIRQAIMTDQSPQSLDERIEALSGAKKAQLIRSVKMDQLSMQIKRVIDPYITYYEMLEQFLSDIVETRLQEALTQFRLEPQIKPHALVEAKKWLEQLNIKSTLDLITWVDLSQTTALTELDIDKVSSFLQTEINKLDLELLRIEEPVSLRKRTNGTKLTQVGYKGEPNHALIRAIITAQAWVEEIKAGQSVSDIVQAQSIPEGMIWKRIRLAFLSPNLLKAIVYGTSNRNLTIKTLTRHDLPLDWSEQQAMF